MRKKIIEIILFLSVVALASVFRLTNLELMEFKADEATNLLLATRLVSGHSILPGGIATSVGILNPPFFIYLLTPFTFISQNPKFIAFIIAFINCLSIGLLFVVIKKYYNQKLAIITSSLIALSPWSILFSRKIWPPDLVLPFAVAILYSLHKIVIEKKMKFWIILTASLIFLFQLDLAYLFFSSILMVFLILSEKRINIKYIIIGFIIGITPLFPYINYQLKNSCPDCSIATTLGNKLAIKRSLSIFIKPFQITNQGDFSRQILGSDTSVFAGNFPAIYNSKIIYYLEYVLIPIGAFIFWARYKKHRFLVYSVFSVPVLYFLFRIQPSMHYFAVLMPFLLIFIGVAIEKFISLENKLLKYIASFLFLTIVIYSVFFNAAFFNFINMRKGTGGDYGSSFDKTYASLQKQFLTYKDKKDFREIILSSYIPLNLMYGSSSFTQMLYPYNQIKKELNNLEEDLKNFPDNPITLRKLTAFNTTRLNKSNLDNLAEKTKNIPGYKPIYKEALFLYLQTNYKKQYDGGITSFTFEYPQHWKL
ncbi:MAG: glycosyltransferase family 39 protein, partial [Candidatus Levybacteria bacterium]|nr:glycosyltransferase family 39 protein [Candidatus Levybacteria bacterium]